MENKPDPMGTMGMLVLIVLVLVAVAGWFMNIGAFYRSLESVNQTPKAAIVRGVGITAFPLGCVIGYITIEGDMEAETKTIYKKVTP